MDLSALVRQYRIEADDLVEPYLASRANVVAWLNEAEREACLRKRLLRMVGEPDLCTIAVTAPTRVFTLNPLVAWIEHAEFTPDGETEPVVLDLVTSPYLDRKRPGWRRLVERPAALIVNDTSVELGCIPESDGTLELEGYRFPLTNIEDSATESPEIHVAHHLYLPKWAVYRCMSRPDSQVLNPGLAERALAEFEGYFGMRPDADRRRDQEGDLPQVNQGWY